MFIANTASRMWQRSSNPKFTGFICAVVFLMLLQPSAYAQMGYGTDYSDTWLVGVNQPTFDSDDNMTMSPDGPPQTYVQGYGSLEDQYNSYGHWYEVTAVLNTPDGRSSEGSAGGDNYTRVDLSIALNGIAGLYSTSHSTVVSCPISNSSFTSGSGYSSANVGISFSVFHKAATISPDRAVYQLISPCDVACVFHPSGAFYRLGTQPQPNYVRIGEPFVILFGHKVCEGLLDSLEESPTPLSCFEISF
jgi:hypothetical protein